MLRIALMTSGLVSLALGILLTIPAAEAQQPPVPELKVLVSQRVEELPQGPLCWDASRMTLPRGDRRPATGYHAHQIFLAYQVEGVHRLEYAGGPTLTVEAGKGLFIGDGNWHVHTNEETAPFTATVFDLTCLPPDTPGRFPHGGRLGFASPLGTTPVLQGIRPGVPYLLQLIEGRGVPGAQSPVQEASGPLTVYILEGEVQASTPAGVGRLKAGDIAVVPPGTPFQATSSGDRHLALLLTPADEAPVKLRPDVRLPSPAAPAALPRTGGELPWAGPIAVLVGLVLLAAGIAMRRTKSLASDLPSRVQQGGPPVKR